MYQIYADEELICDSRVGDLAVINPVLDLEVNKAGTFSFVFPPEHPFYDFISKRTTQIRVVRDGIELFEGICTTSSDDFYKQRTLECEGSLTFLNDSVQRPHKYKQMDLRLLLENIIANHNRVVDESKQFTLGQVTVMDDSVTKTVNYATTMEVLASIVNSQGGYLSVRNTNGVRYLDYFSDSPNTSSQTIRLGENLIDFVSTLDTTEFATVIVPLGAMLEEQSEEGIDERITIEPVNDGIDYLVNEEAVANFGWIEQVVVWDNVTIPSNLKRKAERYLQETQYDAVTIEAKAVDLHIADEEIEPFKILDKIRVVSKPHGLDRYFLITKQHINLNRPESDSVTLGAEVRASLTEQSRKENTEILNKVEQISVPSILDSAKRNTTQLIKNAGNGYITIRYDDDMHPYELLIMDTDNIETATKVWRWNQNGLGYSSTGYDGEYGLAMTSDGQIVADYITTGTMSADRIEGGTLTLGGNNERYGIVEVKDTSGTNIVEINKNGIKVNNASGYSNLICENTDWYTKGKSKTEMNAYDIKVAKEVDGTFKTCFNASNGGIYGYPFDGARYFSIDGRQLVLENDGIHFDIIVQNSGSQAWPWIRGGYGKLDIGVVDTVDLFCSRTKSRIASTDDYGNRLLYCYEMPSPMFGDLGQAVTDEEGICYIYIDDIFAETVDCEVEYQVFLQKYGKGDLYVADRQQNYFVVKGTPNLEFGWELKAIQKDYDSMRLETYEEEENEES